MIRFAAIALMLMLPSLLPAATEFEPRFIIVANRWCRVAAPPTATMIRLRDGKCYDLYDVCGCVLVGKVEIYNAAPWLPESERK